MVWDMINNQWFWLGAAGLFILLLGLLLIRHRIRLQAPRKGNADEQETGWAPTGRIDFAGPTGSTPDLQTTFLLQAEDARIVNSIGGLERHEIRWRNATLKEAKKVVTAYHAQLNLAATGIPLAIPTARNATESELGNGGHDSPVGIHHSDKTA
jgi:hypothetical protein